MPLEKCRISADFLEHPHRPLFHVLVEPCSDTVRGSILFLPPFADEMHISRHIVASSARSLAEAGYAVLIPDYSGCGDGHGSFADASWSIWKEDAQLALEALREKYDSPVSLWGLRSGAMMAAQLASEQDAIARLFLWQPVLNGEQQIDQFLRLEAAATALQSGDSFDRGALWGALRAGQMLEIAGYELPSKLALEMAQIRLGALRPRCAVDWIEISPTNSVSPGASRTISGWQEQGVSVSVNAVQGEPFWRMIDPQVNPALESLTLAAFAAS
ncbi:MAG: hydrolase 2, exosortase A system-associated [Halioglobus sp.]